MLPLYRALLRLYPAAYRCEFANEMTEVLSEVQGEVRKKNAMTRISFVMRETGGLLGGALQEHLQRVTGSYDHGIFSVRRFAMKSEFRFPKATVGLMLAILAAVMLAIEKAKAISASIPRANPPVPPIHSLQATIVQTLLGTLILGHYRRSDRLGHSICPATHRGSTTFRDESGSEPTRR